MEAPRGQKTICLPFQSEEHYEQCVRSPDLFRKTLMESYEQHPELFPARFGEGFTLDDKRHCERQQLWIRRIRLRTTRQKFTVRPSLVLPYMIATTDEVEKGLYLR